MLLMKNAYTTAGIAGVGIAAVEYAVGPTMGKIPGVRRITGHATRAGRIAAMRKLGGRAVTGKGLSKALSGKTVDIRTGIKAMKGILWCIFYKSWCDRWNA